MLMSMLQNVSLCGDRVRRINRSFLKQCARITNVSAPHRTNDGVYSLLVVLMSGNSLGKLIENRKYVMVGRINQQPTSHHNQFLNPVVA